jgi:hypothetical protein
MEEAMTQLLAQRMGLSGEQYDALRSGNPAPLLGNQGSDPLMAALFSSMLSRKPENVESDSETEHDHTQCQRELLRAKKTIAKLKDGLASADTMANHIAEIFGACEFCWGLNKLCPRCGGRGGPGFADPKQEELLGWIEPALQKLGLTVTKAT